MNAGKRDGRETADILRIHSVRFKYLVTLFVVIFLACGITYLVTFINIWGRMQQSAELQIQSVVDIFAGFMDRSGLTTRDIVDELRKRLDVVEVYERADELPGPFSGAALEPGKLEMRTVEGRFEGAVRMPDGYLYLSVTPPPGPVHGDPEAGATDPLPLRGDREPRRGGRHPPRHPPVAKAQPGHPAGGARQLRRARRL